MPANLMNLSAAQLLDLMQKGGLLGFLALTLVGIFKGWWYPSFYVRKLEDRIGELQADLQRLRDDRDDWKVMALTGTNAAERATSLATQRAR